MANSREALFQWSITKAMSAGGWEYVSWLELPHYRLIEREEERLLLEVAGEGYGLTSVNDARFGKLQDPEKQRLAEIIGRLHDVYGIEASDDNKLHFTNRIADRIERDEAVTAQVRNHSEDLVMHGLFPKKVSDAVLDSMSDQEKLFMPLLRRRGNGEAFALLRLGFLARRSERDESPRT